MCPAQVEGAAGGTRQRVSHGVLRPLQDPTACPFVGSHNTGNAICWPTGGKLRPQWPSPATLAPTWGEGCCSPTCRPATNGCCRSVSQGGAGPGNRAGGWSERVKTLVLVLREMLALGHNHGGPRMVARLP